MQDLDLSIIVLNWNTARLLDGCLGSLIENTAGISYEAFIIDNNSKGDGFDRVAKKYADYPNFHWVKNEDNIGGIADNRVLPLCQGRYIAHIGNDTIILPGCFKNLVEFMDAHEEAGAASARLLNPDGSNQSYFARFHDLPMFFWRATLIGSAIDKLFFRGKYARYYWYSDLDPEKLNVVDQPPGPCLVMRRAGFVKDYIFDENIPLYFSDVDLCRRIYDSGYKIYVVPTAPIIHFPGSSFKKADQKWAAGEYRKSLLWYFKKYYPGQVPLLRLLLAADALPQYFYRGLRDITINLYRKELADCDSILDLGCGSNSPIQYINAAYTLGVDIDEKVLKASDEQALHTEYMKADIRVVEFDDKSFDAVMLIDVLQFLDKNEGKAIISRAEKWARKKLIITVPNNYKYNGHVKSTWNMRDLNSQNSRVYGLGGPRVLHGEGGNIKFRPRLFWKGVSFLCQRLIYRMPQLAFLLCAVKETGPGK